MNSHIPPKPSVAAIGDAPKGTHLTRVDLLIKAITERIGKSSWSFVTFHLPNIRYLSNFSGSSAAVVISVVDATEVRLTLITDRRYLSQASGELAELIASTDIDAAVIDQGAGSLTQMAGKVARDSETIVAEFAHITHSTFLELINSVAPQSAISDATSAIESLRTIKDPHEIALIAQAATIADGAFRETAQRLTSPITELEFAARLNSQMMMLGAGGPSFDTIVASGPNSAMPHAKPTNRVIERGDIVVVDFGAEYRGYRSDCTRTVVAGGEAGSKRFQSAYDAVARAQTAGIDAISAGNEVAAIDLACRSALEPALRTRFNHGTGHGVGLDIHELPWVSERSELTQGANMVITVEPGIYFDGEFGIRIEDTLLITETGSRSLTALPK